MKKLLVLVCTVLLAIPAISVEKAKVSKLDYSNIRIPECDKLYDYAIKTQNPNDMTNVLKCGLNNKKEHLTFDEKQFVEHAAISGLVFLNLERYQITQDKKQLREAYKYSRMAVDKRVPHEKTILAAINLASQYLNTKEMIKGYDWLCAFNQKECDNIRSEFSEKMTETKYKIAERAQRRAAAIQAGAQSLGTSFSDVTTNCYERGNSIHCGTNYNRW